MLKVNDKDTRATPYSLLISQGNKYIIYIIAESTLLNTILNELKFPISLAKDSKAAISHILEEYERFNTYVLIPVNCVIL